MLESRYHRIFSLFDFDNLPVNCNLFILTILLMYILLSL